MLTSLLITAVVRSQGDPAVNCVTDSSKNCQTRAAPSSTDPAVQAAWLTEQRAWATSLRSELSTSIADGFKAYDEPTLDWARTAYIQAQVMVHDRMIYDREAQVYTADKYLDDLIERYGGLDTVLLWQGYTNLGCDDANQFDILRALPGGIDGARELVKQFHARGVHVMWPLFIWDHGTRDEGKPFYVSLTDFLHESDSDGINGDTCDGVNASYLIAGQGTPQEKYLLLEAQSMGTRGVHDGFQNVTHDVSSWGESWKYTRAPLVSAYKLVEQRHLVHLCNRFEWNRTDSLHTAFFNGIGYETWENIWGMFNKVTPRDGETLRRVSTMLRHYGDLLSSPDFVTAWTPHAPHSLHNGVYVSRWSNATVTLLHIVNRDAGNLVADEKKPIVTMPCVGGADERFFDIWNGHELTGQVKCNPNTHLAPIAFNLNELGFGALLLFHPAGPDSLHLGPNITADFANRHHFSTTATKLRRATRNANRGGGGSSSPPNIFNRNRRQLVGQEDEGNGLPSPEWLAFMRGLTRIPLNTFRSTFEPLQQERVVDKDGPGRDPSQDKPAEDPPAGMKLIPGGLYDFAVRGTIQQGFTNQRGDDIQLPWEPFPMRDHRQLITMSPMFMDTHPVTNAKYKEFITASGYVPRTEQMFLNHWEAGTYPTSPKAGTENQPVRFVARDDALAYCNHYNARLPTMWEWQWAAQGNSSRKYPWGDNECSTCFPPLQSGRDQAEPSNVDAHPDGATPETGVEDLWGNVYQFTDIYRDAHTDYGLLRGGTAYNPHEVARYYFPHVTSLAQVGVQTCGESSLLECCVRVHALTLSSVLLSSSLCAALDVHHDVRLNGQEGFGRVPLRRRREGWHTRAPTPEHDFLPVPALRRGAADRDD